MSSFQTNQLQPDEREPILASVFDSLQAAGFVVERLQPDIPTTSIGQYRVELLSFLNEKSLQGTGPRPYRIRT